MRIAPLLGSSLVASAALMVPSVARADGPPVNPALGVYVEQIPTGKGSVAAKRDSQRSKLGGSVGQKIQREGGTDAGVLNDLATSAGLGAPQKQASGAKTGRSAAHQGSNQQTRVAAPVATAQGTSNSNRWQVIALVLGIVLITATMAAAQFMRSRRAGPSP
jgi:hypothetical protein